MIGLLIVAHGTLGESLIHCASHVMGKRPLYLRQLGVTIHDDPEDRKSTRLNSSHTVISYAVFCLKTENNTSELYSLSDVVCILMLSTKRVDGRQNSARQSTVSAVHLDQSFNTTSIILL